MKLLNEIKKNKIIIYVIALMLVVAGYLNYNGNIKENTIQTSTYQEKVAQANIGDAQLVSSNIQENIIDKNINEDEEKENAIETSTNDKNLDEDNYFSVSKLERDKMYSQILESYEKVLNSNNSSETQKQSAQDEITKINNTKNSIMICENLIKTKGFIDDIIFVNGNSINIIVQDSDLTTEEVAQIQNIVAREMNAKLENIHISSK